MYPITAFDHALHKQSITVDGAEATLTGFAGYSKALGGKEYDYVWWLHCLKDNTEFVITLTDSGTWSRYALPEEFVLYNKEQRYLCWCHCVENLMTVPEAVAVTNIPAALTEYLNTPDIPPKAWYKEHTWLKILGNTYTDNEPITQIFSKAKLVQQYRLDQSRTRDSTRFVFMGIALAMILLLMVGIGNQKLITIITALVLGALCLIVFLKTSKSRRELRFRDVPVEIQKLRCVSTRVQKGDGDNHDIHYATFVDQFDKEQEICLGWLFNTNPKFDGEDCILVFLDHRRAPYVVGTACSTRIVD